MQRYIMPLTRAPLPLHGDDLHVLVHFSEPLPTRMTKARDWFEQSVAKA